MKPFHVAASKHISMISGKKRGNDKRWKKRTFILLPNLICIYKHTGDSSFEELAVDIEDVHVNAMTCKYISSQGKKDFWVMTIPVKMEHIQEHLFIKVYREEIANHWMDCIKKIVLKRRNSLSRGTLNLNRKAPEDTELLYNVESGTLDKATVDLYNFMKMIESITELDLFAYLKMKIKTLLKHKPHPDVLATIDLCERPCYMLKIDQHIDPEYDPRLYQNIEEIVDRLSICIDRLRERGDDLAIKELLELKKFYEEEVEHFQSVGYKTARIPPITVAIGNRNSTSRLMSRNVYEKITEGIRQKYGCSKVTFFNDIYWKKDPTFPAIEFAVDLASKLVTNQGSSPTLLLKVVTHNPITLEEEVVRLQASKGVRGYHVNEMINEKPSLISKIDKYNYGLVFIVGLLTLPQDGKGDNIIASEDANGNIVFTGIDNDHAFADPIVSHKGNHYVNVRNLLFCFPQADEVVDSRARDRILSLSPALTTLSWLQGLNEQNLFYTVLKDAKYFSRTDYEAMNLPTKLRKGTSSSFYITLTKIQEYLRQSKNITLNQIFQYIYPELFTFYDYILKKPNARNNIEETFSKYIFTSDYYEDIPELISKEIIIGGKRISVKDALTKYENNSHDYITQRDRMPYEELEELLSVIDLSELNEEDERKFIRKLFSFSFVKFTLNGSKRFDGHDLKEIIDKSPSLIHLELNNCDKITSEDLKVLIVKRCQPIVHLSGTSIKPSEVTELRTQNLNVILKGHESRQLRPSLGPTAVVVPQIMNALEFIRNGKFDIAARQFENAMREDPDILRKYDAQINALVCGTYAFPLFTSKAKRLIKLLVDRIDWDVGQIVDHGMNGWHISVQEGHIDWCKELVQMGININALTLSEHRNALHIAVLEGNIKMIEYLLTLKGLDIDHLDKEMNSPLALAITSPNLVEDLKVKIAITLIDKGVDVNGKFGPEQNTALHLAAQKKLMSIALKLLEKGVSINEANINGESPLHYACLYRCEDSNKSLVDILLERGSNVGAKTSKQCTTFHYAVKGTSKTILQKLVEKAPHIAEISDYQHYNLLHEAARQREWVSEDILPYLLTILKDKIEERTVHHKTPLMIAVQANINLSAMKLLIEAGANVNAKDGSGDTILMWAVNAGDYNLTKFLIETAKADPNIFNTNGMTPMWRAVSILYKEDPYSVSMGRRESSVGGNTNSVSVNTTDMPTFLKNATYLFENEGNLSRPNEYGDYIMHILPKRILNDPLHCTGVFELNFLIKCKVDLTPTNESGETFLHLLMSRRIVGSDAKRRIENVINAMNLYFTGIAPVKPSTIIYKENNQGLTVLHKAVEIDCVEYVKRLAEEDGYAAYVTQFTKKKGEHNPLFIAVRAGSASMIKTLIEVFGNYMHSWEIKNCMSIIKEKKNQEIMMLLSSHYDHLKELAKKKP